MAEVDLVNIPTLVIKSASRTTASGPAQDVRLSTTTRESVDMSTAIASAMIRLVSKSRTKPTTVLLMAKFLSVELLQEQNLQ